MAYELTEQKKVVLGLLGFGILFTFLGVVLFFDRGLLALGNIFWLSGVALLLGWRSTVNVFTSRANVKGSASFLIGLFFLFVRWPILGIVLELYGCLVLFGCSSVKFQFWDGLYDICSEEDRCVVKSASCVRHKNSLCAHCKDFDQ